MTVLNPPLYLQAGTYPASLDNTAHAAMLQADDVAQRTRSGVIFNNFASMRVTASGGTSVSVADGRCAIDNEQGGAYLCTNRGATTVSIPATTAQPRRDIIGCRVLDSENGDAGNVWNLLRVEGSAAASPVDPVLPDFFIPLARVRMPASTSAVSSTFVDDLRVFTSAAGGVIVCTSGTRPATTKQPYGQMIFETDTLVVRIYDGTNWAVIPTQGLFTAVTAASVPATFKGTTGQTGNLSEWRDPSNTLLGRISSSGQAFFPALFSGGTAVSVVTHTHDASGYVVSQATSALRANALKQSGTGPDMTFNWSGQGGQPSWLWGGNDGINHYVYNPSAFSVAYAANSGFANSAGSAPANGGTAAVVSSPGVYHASNGLTVSAFGGFASGTIRVDASGNMYAAASSSRRYKKLIANAQIDPAAILRLVPRTFFFDGDAEEIDEVKAQLPMQYGLIAEEADEAGAVGVVGYDNQGRPNEINFDALTMGLLATLKAQNSEISTLRAALNALTDRVDALPNG